MRALGRRVGRHLTRAAPRPAAARREGEGQRRRDRRAPRLMSARTGTGGWWSRRRACRTGRRLEHRGLRRGERRLVEAVAEAAEDARAETWPALVDRDLDADDALDLGLPRLHRVLRRDRDLALRAHDGIGAGVGRPARRASCCTLLVAATGLSRPAAAVGAAAAAAPGMAIPGPSELPSDTPRSAKPSAPIGTGGGAWRRLRSPAPPSPAPAVLRARASASASPPWAAEGAAAGAAWAGPSSSSPRPAAMATVSRRLRLRQHARRRRRARRGR